MKEDGGIHTTSRIERRRELWWSRFLCEKRNMRDMMRWHDNPLRDDWICTSSRSREFLCLSIESKGIFLKVETPLTWFQGKSNDSWYDSLFVSLKRILSVEWPLHRSLSSERVNHSGGSFHTNVFESPSFSKGIDLKFNEGGSKEISFFQEGWGKIASGRYRLGETSS